MFSRVIKSALSVSLTAIALLAGAAASGQSVQTIQTLDRVDVYNKSKVLEMEFDDPGRTFDFTALDITPATAAGFVACQVTANQALYCIDGKDVRYWPQPAQVAAPNTTGSLLFSCTDAALGLNGASTKPCTALTVDLSRSIWLAGMKGDGTYSLFKLVAKVGSCPASPWFALQGAAYCAREYASGRRLLSDIVAIDGDVGAAFTGPGGVKGPGVLAIERAPLTPIFLRTSSWSRLLGSWPIRLPCRRLSSHAAARLGVSRRVSFCRASHCSSCRLRANRGILSWRRPTRAGSLRSTRWEFRLHSRYSTSWPSVHPFCLRFLPRRSAILIPSGMACVPAPSRAACTLQTAIIARPLRWSRRRLPASHSSCGTCRRSETNDRGPHVLHDCCISAGRRHDRSGRRRRSQHVRHRMHAVVLSERPTGRQTLGRQGPQHPVGHDALPGKGHPGLSLGPASLRGQE